jgi:hypothetical protein
MPFCLSAGGRADPGSSRCLRPFGLLRQRAHLPPCGACNDYRLAITGLEDGILDRVTSGSVRSLACIDRHDLLRLAELAAEVEAGLFARNPQGAGRYAGRLLCRALCQGAALHYLNTTNGVKDFDVWSFYAERDDGPFPYRWRGTADFGPSKFGRYPGDPRSFTGRRVDLLGRSLDARPDAEPATAPRDYLSAAHTASAKALAAKAAILIDPHQLVGRVVWPEDRPSR